MFISTISASRHLAICHARASPRPHQEIHRRCTQPYCSPPAAPAHTYLAPLQNVPEQLRARTHEAVLTRFPEIGLLPFGVEFTDGYRLPMGRAFPQPYIENNVTSIMAMGIATRERALQVLEGTQNNLEDAVNILLGLQ
jgi:hypothetical protein